MSRVRSSLALALACAGLVLGAGCASSGSKDIVEVASAEDLYQQGMQMLEDKSGFLGLDFSDYQAAIDKFQDIIDNYPYSDYAVLAELRIADAHFAQHQWEEALSYYRDFAQLHPDHEKVPYTIYQRALCHERQSRSSNRDQTQTREAVSALDELITRYPNAQETGEAEVLWKAAAHEARRAGAPGRRLLLLRRGVSERGQPLPHGDRRVPGPRARRRGALQARALLHAHESRGRRAAAVRGDPRELPGQPNRRGRRGPDPLGALSRAWRRA